MKNLALAVREKYKFQKHAAIGMGVDGGNLSNLIKKGDPSKLRGETLINLERGFPEYNIDWLLEKSSIKLKKDVVRLSQIKPSPDGDGILLPDGRTIGRANAAILGDVTDDSETKFTEISPGRYRMKIQLVPEFASAGYLRGFSDPEYIEELPIHETIVDRYYRGKYMAFQISGDSMFDGSYESILDKSVAIGRMIKRELWNSRLHSHQWPNWIFVTKTEGIVCKQIASQNLEKGTLVLHSLNPDKNQYPDFEIHLDDVYQIFNVIKTERTY